MTLFEKSYTKLTHIQQIKLYTDYTNNCIYIYLEHWFSSGGDFASQEIFGNDLKYFLLL